MGNLTIRPILKSEYPILETFLYEAIHIPPGYEPPERDVIYVPELNIYIKDFGKPDDVCFVAEAGSEIIGVAWSRILAEPDNRGYGNIDEHTPELSISVLPEYRNEGVGGKLLTALHEELSQRGYKSISLSVQKTNAALHLYERSGYRIIEENAEDYIMVRALDA